MRECHHIHFKTTASYKINPKIYKKKKKNRKIDKRKKRLKNCCSSKLYQNRDRERNKLKFTRAHTYRGRSNGRSTTEGLESSIDNLSGVLVDLNLEFHNIAASRCADQPCTDVRVIFVKGSNIPGIVVVIDNPLVVKTRQKLRSRRRRRCLR